MKKQLAIYLLKILNMISENTDYNDVWYFIELLLANQEEVEQQLEMEFHRSNAINSKKIRIREVGFTRFTFDEDEDGNEIKIEKKQVYTYCFDGNGTKRICTLGPENNFIDVEYQHREFEEIIGLAEELKNKCLTALSGEENLIFCGVMKNSLIDYSEKCYRIGACGAFLPKSQIGFDGDKVLMPPWLAKKNRLLK